MSIDNEFDLEKLFLPAWAQEEPSSSKYAKYEGEEERPERKGDRRGSRFGGAPGGRRPPARQDGERRSPQGGGPRPRGGSRPDRGPQGERTQGRGQFGDRRGPRRPEPRPRREPPAPLPEIDLAVIPDEKGVESLARQIKMSGRAYPLFDIAQMILQKPERHAFAFSVKKNAEGQPVQPLYLCALDDTLWLSENEAVAHVLKKQFNTFYQAERTATEPPKGKYTFVAQCGMSGIILGPPNHHDYQNQLRKLHGERFSRLPFEVYKSRVKIVRDEEVVKKWVDDQSWKTEYICLNMPEPVRLPDMGAVEKHFRENHKDNIIKQIESQTVSGAAARAFRSPELSRLVRSSWEDQRRFPLQIATVLSQQFASHGLQFFKVNRTITHVSVARPHYLDLALIPVSDGVKRIVEFINANPKSSRRQLIEALAPTPAPPTPVPVEAPATETGAAPSPVAEKPGPTPEQTAVIADLHWLIHQGHVIEFANGVLESAKKPLPKPPKAEPKAQPKADESGTAPATPSESGVAEASGLPAPSEGSEPVQSENAPQTQDTPSQTPVSEPVPASLDSSIDAASGGETTPPPGTISPGLAENGPTAVERRTAEVPVATVGSTP
jgi:hypothetical protein